MKTRFDSHGCGVLHEDGCLSEVEDPIKRSVLGCIQDLPKEQRDYIDARLYRLIELLTHNIKLPFYRRIDTPDASKIADVFRILMKLQCTYLEHVWQVLYDIIDGKSAQSLWALFTRMNIYVDRFDLWLAEIKRAIEDCIPHLESLMFIATEEIRNRRQLQGEADDSPANAIRWLSENYKLVEPLDKTSLVYWITEKQRYKICLERASDAEIQEINNSQTIFDFSVKLRNLVVKLNRYNVL